MNGKTLTAEQCSKLSLYILMTTKTREGEAEAWEKLAEEKKDGNGYCCMVERSKTQREKVRRPDMERCELYKPGDFNTRYRTEVNE